MKQVAQPVAGEMIPCELDGNDLEELDDDDSDAVATQKRAAIDPTSDTFMKIR
jgi:hypothetical protein